MNDPLIHSMEGNHTTVDKKKFIPYVVIVVAGILSGLLLSKFSAKTAITMTGSAVGGPSGAPIGGLPAEKILRDSAQGSLESGGIDGEGTHKLIRPGGMSQTVYLTSSLLALEQYVGKNIKVWGETFAAKKAGWLMDVGKVEVLGN